MKFAIFFMTILASCIIVSCSRSDSPVESTKKKIEVIAYYTGNPQPLSDQVTDKIDQIIFSFLHLKGNKLAIDNSKDSLTLKYLVSLKEQKPDLKILISLGGWGGCETCSEVFKSEEARKEFSASVLAILEELNADGIDLDWEYPAIEGYPGHPYAPEDKENFTELVKELRSTLGNQYEISFAAGGFDAFLEQSIEWEKVMPLLNRVNLMSYDLVHGFSELTGHHTPLYSTINQNLSTHKALEFFDKTGVPREKVVIGAAFYGRVWENVPEDNNGLYQEGKFLRAVNFHSLSKYFEENPGFIQFWDSAAHAPYAYNPDKKLFITFDDTASIASKTNYVLENNLGGIMFWQLSGDKETGGLLNVIDKVRRK
jgi:chitinase